MMRSKPASSMQKTYDDCYLICSTAVYFESKNNEEEALRSWRSALDQIYYHNAYRVPPTYRPKTETEKALQDSLHDMEVQCKERVDLLEALKKSRTEAKDGDKTTTNGQPPATDVDASTPKAAFEATTPGWSEQRTTPAVHYPDLSRPPPALPPRLIPHRPSYASNMSSVNDVPRSASVPEASSSTMSPPTLAPHIVVPPKKGSRTPSPEKKGGMLRTLRAGGGKERTSSGRMVSGLRNNRPPAAAKAATQAWGSIQSPNFGSGTDHSLGDTNGASTSSAATAWDPYTRLLVERPPSRDRMGPNVSRTPSNNVIRTPSPSDFTRSSNDEPLLDLGRLGSNNAPYPDYPHLEPPSLPKSFAYSSEDLLGPGSAEHSSPGKISRRPPEQSATKPRPRSPARLPKLERNVLSYRKEYPKPLPTKALSQAPRPHARRSDSGPAREMDKLPVPTTVSQPHQELRPAIPRKAINVVTAAMERHKLDDSLAAVLTSGEEGSSSSIDRTTRRRRRSRDQDKATSPESLTANGTLEAGSPESAPDQAWEARAAALLRNLPKGVDETAAKQILNEIVIQGDEVHWNDVAGLEIAKAALKETVVYPFLRPDLFMGLREPARGMLLFGPPGTGKTMLARAVATESKSTFFAISASSLTSKYLGESEKLVRALFALAKALAPSIIFVDEIDSLLSARGGGSEHEATRRIKTEFLIQWSDLAKAAAGSDRTSDKEKERGDASRVLVLAATNLPWAIDEAARRRFVRRQYIPLPEDWVRKTQLRTLLSHQKHSLSDDDLDRLVRLTEDFSGSDITALAKDAAMGPLRSLGEKLLHMTMDEIRPIQFQDFQASLINIRPSVSKQGLKEFEDWAKEFGERGG
ncbi:hypothetical protein LTR66_001301 [Elasticomyces elasticus]|nr:hypothetical protein LTR66_001301 [Elasticomyces elasticus]